MLSFLTLHLPSTESIQGRYVEPFVGGAAVYLFIGPDRAMLSDINQDLIDLYLGIKHDPEGVWSGFSSMPRDKKGYYRVRAIKPDTLCRTERAARLLYLNRTCFKGMWRHNGNGQFNVGYGGEDRRWVISRDDLVSVSTLLARAEVRCADFEETIDACTQGDFIFLDPPYRPGARELTHDHYQSGQRFTFQDQERLAAALLRATHRGVGWVMTNSAHSDILRLYHANSTAIVPRGTGSKPGSSTAQAREVLITSHQR